MPGTGDAEINLQAANKCHLSWSGLQMHFIGSQHGVLNLDSLLTHNNGVISCANTDIADTRLLSQNVKF